MEQGNIGDVLEEINFSLSSDYSLISISDVVKMDDPSSPEIDIDENSFRVLPYLVNPFGSRFGPPPNKEILLSIRPLNIGTYYARVKIGDNETKYKINVTE